MPGRGRQENLLTWRTDKILKHKITTGMRLLSTDP